MKIHEKDLLSILGQVGCTALEIWPDLNREASAEDILADIKGMIAQMIVKEARGELPDYGQSNAIVFLALYTLGCIVTIKGQKRKKSKSSPDD